MESLHLSWKITIKMDQNGGGFSSRYVSSPECITTCIHLIPKAAQRRKRKAFLFARLPFPNSSQPFISADFVVILQQKHTEMVSEFFLCKAIFMFFYL